MGAVGEGLRRLRGAAARAARSARVATAGSGAERIAPVTAIPLAPAAAIEVALAGVIPPWAMIGMAERAASAPARTPREGPARGFESG